MEEARTRTLQLLAPLSDEELNTVYSPILSPLAWDMGHIANFEELWLVQTVGGREPLNGELGRFYDAMDAAQHIVWLKPIGVELIDRTMIELARQIAIFRPTLDQFVRGTPDAILLVEFGEDDQDENLRRLKQLGELHTSGVLTDAEFEAQKAKILAG